jgi:hypothetical protein
MTSRILSGPIIVGAIVAALLFTAGAPVWWSGLGFVGTWAALLGCGLAWLPGSLASDRWSGPALIAASGIACAWFLWTASGYLTGGMTAGSVAVVVVGAVGWVRAIRGNLTRPPERPELIAIAIALGAGFYLTGLNEIWGSDRVFFTFRYDWDVHLHIAGIISEHGLPKLEHSGAARYPIDAVSHVGWPVLVAGVESLTQTSLFTAARGLTVGGFAVIALAACGIARRRLDRLPVVLLVSVAPLVWGGLALAASLARGDVDAILDLRQAWPGPGIVSGVMYYNATQLFAVALVLAGLAVLDRDELPRPIELAAGYALIAISASIKPSLAIVVVPALLLVLTAARRWRELAVVLAVSAAIAAIYFLPALLADELPPRIGWTIGLPDDARSALAHLAATIGVLALVAARWIGLLFAATSRRAVMPGAVVTLALGGALVFALLFREVGRSHGNQFWPLVGIVVVMTPFALAELVRWPKPGFRRVVVHLLIGVHLTAGLIYAANSPAIRARSLKPAQIEAVVAMRELTPKDARVHVMPGVPRILAPFYRRRANWRPPLIASELPAYKRWAAVARGEAPFEPSIVADRDAVILTRRSRRLGPELEALGWTRSYRGDRTSFELWLAPGVSARR